MRWAPLAVLVLAAGCGQQNTTMPPVGEKRADAAGLPDTWTHREVADHLGKKGLKVTVGGIPDSASPHPVSVFKDAAATEKAGAIVVHLCKDVGAAHEQAGSMGEGAFSKGRFAFGLYDVSARESDKRFLQRIKAAMDAP
ncbi:unnamed protein product [Gemmataceae bacterium]|nr:unnamed protein product [Gemmataceae bacterium]VTT96567.1 unnamed protein product [Gemmataceae bacterium]